MTYRNTTATEDSYIRDAVNGTIVSELLVIIERLDDVITEWLDAAELANCDSPRELRDFIHSLPST